MFLLLQQGWTHATSGEAGLMMLARLTSAKAANTCTMYISNSSQMPWYTKGAGCRHLRMSQHVLERPRDILLHLKQ